MSKFGVVTFSRVTGENVGQRLAIMLNGQVQSAPRIDARISQPDVRITGSFTKEDAEDLALVLRSGSLPASVTIVEEGITK